MRHDIPHRWARTFSLRGFTCPVCCLPSGVLTYGRKCSECALTVHDGCAEQLHNTCGMPMEMYGDYLSEMQRQVSTAAVEFIVKAALRHTPAIDQAPKRARTDSHRTPTPVNEARMCGFVKLWSSQATERGWQPAYAQMDEKKLTFHASDADAARGNAIKTIDLASEKWRMRFQSRPDDDPVMRQLTHDDAPFLVEMKIAEDE